MNSSGVFTLAGSEMVTGCRVQTPTLAMVDEVERIKI